MKLNKQTAGIILLSAFFVQLIIIMYNQATGYIQVTGAGNFVIRLVYSTVLSFLFGLALVYLDLKLINILDRLFPWQKKSLTRFLLEVPGSVAAAMILGSILTFVSHSLNPYDDGLLKNIINNSLITTVINFIIIGILEAVIFFRRNKEASIKAEKLEKENVLIQMETLKNQLNPHFLFNSLNVLSALVGKDSARAECFIEEFSSVYRYVLDVFDKQVVELREELSFAKSYLYLQQIRFEDSITVEVNVDASKLSSYIPPLAVQTLLENAFKHNKISKEHPLQIRIFNDEAHLYVTNNLRLKPNTRSSGIGLKNLKKRYEYISGELPKFSISNDEYTAKLPLITAD